jgi:glycosyltransferase involved in cell wall biosynthesis
VIQPPVGGAPVLVDLLVREQVARHDVGVVGRPAMARRLAGSGARVWTLPMGRSINPLEDLGNLRRLIAIVRGFRPDVVHAHSSKAGVLGRLAGRACGVPVVLSPHNFAHRIYEGGRAARTVFLLVEIALSPLTTHLHVSHGEEKRHALRAGLARRGRVTVIPNGILTSPLLAIADPPRRAPVVGTYARLWPQKRIDILVRAAARLESQGVPVALRIIGGGPLESDLRELIAELGLSDAQILADPGGPAAALAMLDIYVLSSVQEAMPLVPIEAMAAGRTVIASAIGGVPEVFDDGTTGLLVAPGDVDALTEALRRVLSDGELRRELGRAAREVARGYDISRTADALELVYEAALV